MEFEHIKELIKQVSESNIEEFSFKQHSTEITIKKKSENSTNFEQNIKVAATSPSISEPSEPKTTLVQETEQPITNNIEDENLYKITSPMVGTFYSSSSPEAENYVSNGNKVNKDTVVCIVEAMKLFNEISADVKGEIVEILVENGQLVEYGQPLFLVRPE